MSTSSESDKEVQNTPSKKKKYNVSYRPDREKEEHFQGWLSKSGKGKRYILIIKTAR